MTALWYRTGHLSIGASTAVFGAVGILAATQLTLDKTAGPRPWLERAAPVVGGLALLGMLGASPHSDLLAHLFGLFAGILVGLVAGRVMHRSQRSSPWVQIGCALLTVGIVLGSWGLAFRSPV
jgi:membrane associated rhomboid family serine protease